MTLESAVSPQVLNKYLILRDVKSGRFEYQSGRFEYQSGKAGDEAKKRKSPAKNGRVGINVNGRESDFFVKILETKIIIECYR